MLGKARWHITDSRLSNNHRTITVDECVHRNELASQHRGATEVTCITSFFSELPVGS